MIEILYLAHNRLEFTKASLKALYANTDWTKVKSLHVYDDNSIDGTRQWLEDCERPFTMHLHCGKWGGPVAVMNDYIQQVHPRMFAKIDSDTMLPPGWLDECMKLMFDPTIDLLGIEPMHPVDARAAVREAVPARHIGGIGLMRGRAFQHSLPRPDGRFGFTGWQEHDERIKKAWIVPALPVFLLDRMPTEPWVSLSLEYERKGWQRPWAKYREDQSAMWEWWQK